MLFFIAIWTWWAGYIGSFVGYSIPFWIIGFSKVYVFIKRISESQTIKIDQFQLRLEKKWSLGATVFQKPIHEIESCQMKSPLLTTDKLFLILGGGINAHEAIYGTVEMPAIVVEGIEDNTFFEFMSPQEQKWAVNVLNAALHVIKKSK